MLKKFKRPLLLALICLLPLFALAELPSDKTAKLYIVSDNAQLNKATGISVFSGNVKVDHGSTHVTADKLTTYSDKNNQVIKAIAEGANGNFATYQTMTDPKKPPLNAKALIIQYFPQQHYVILIGQAVVTQGPDSITGPQLEYDLKNQILITKNNGSMGSGRTKIVIQPNDVEQSSGNLISK
ncbi:MAG: lipopolysaccharide transport periplasmic protein LptA [Gammaproteobacteria bacterium]|nr:lipopolysaccharide transport periplasmic protein LptA [Gammaproteobacteria bacterium]